MYSEGQDVLLCFEPAAVLQGLSMLHLTILPYSNQDGTRAELEQLCVLCTVVYVGLCVLSV